MIPPEESTDNAAEFWSLAEAVCNGTIEPAQYERLNALLLADEDAARRYATYVRMHGLLLWHCQGADVRPASTPTLPIILETPLFPAVQTSPFSGLLSPGGYLFSYSLAVFIVGVGLLIGWACQVSIPRSDHREMAAAAPRPVPADIRPEHEMVFVGRVTGMVECQWADPSTEPFNGAHVPLGRKYALAAGLMEITYDAGAKVILEGPCTYQVESKTGGCLSFGKLTARVEKKAAVGGPKAEANKASRRPTDRPQLAESSSSLRLPPSVLFTVRTSNATITDIGTEFAVKAAKDGSTSEVQVFQGEVVCRFSGAEGKTDEIHVQANRAVRVGASKKPCVAIPFSPKSFVRQLTRAVEVSREETAYTSAVLADKPLGYWPLNEAAPARKFLDRSGHGIHGSATGRVSAGRRGPFPGKSFAVGLDGAGWIDIGRQDRFAMPNGFSVEAWLWIAQPASFGRFISFDNVTDDSARRIGWGAGYLPAFMVGWKDAARPGFFFTSYSAKDVPLDGMEPSLEQWMHVAVVLDRDNRVHLYVNGTHRVSASGEPAKVGSVCGSIGAMASGCEFWRGKLAHVAVYPRTLDADSVLRHYKQATTTSKRETPMEQQ